MSAGQTLAERAVEMRDATGIGLFECVEAIRKADAAAEALALRAEVARLLAEQRNLTNMLTDALSDVRAGESAQTALEATRRRLQMTREVLQGERDVWKFQANSPGGRVSFIDSVLEET